MRDLAREVFFRENRFVMVPEGGARNVVDRLPEQIHAEKFLREVVPMDAMKYVRTLELVFPPFRTPSISSPYKEWEDTLKAVRGDLNLPKLTIRVCFADKRPYDEPGSSQDEPFRPIMPMKDSMHIYASHVRVLRPLGQLEGLGRFFVKVAWPWEWTKRGRWRRREEREGVQRGVEDAEGRIERFVMGEGYESGMAGKGGDGGESVDAGWGGVWLSCWV